MFDKLNLSASERKLSDFKSGLGKGDSLYRDREKLVRTYENLKSDIQRIVEVIMRDEFKENNRNHMRSDNDVHRSVFYYMALAEKHGKLRYVTRKESMHVEIQKERHYRRLEKFRPMFFCMNDSEYAKDKDRKTAKEYLERRFPDKSEFEK